MLGRLARWLRLLGCDTLYADSTMDDAALLALASAEGRTLLTRDGGIAARRTGKGAVLVASADPAVQVGEVVKSLGLEIDGSKLFSRCSLCNTPVVPATKGDARGSVPENVFAKHDEFFRCPACGKFYWKGSHWKRMREFVEGLGSFTRTGAS